MNLAICRKTYAKVSVEKLNNSLKKLSIFIRVFELNNIFDELLDFFKKLFNFLNDHFQKNFFNIVKLRLIVFLFFKN